MCILFAAPSESREKRVYIGWWWKKKRIEGYSALAEGQFPFQPELAQLHQIDHCALTFSKPFIALLLSCQEPHNVLWSG